VEPRLDELTQVGDSDLKQKVARSVVCGVQLSYHLHDLRVEDPAALFDYGQVVARQGRVARACSSWLGAWFWWCFGTPREAGSSSKALVTFLSVPSSRELIRS
jgi:hypothetical protein